MNTTILNPWSILDEMINARQKGSANMGNSKYVVPAAKLGERQDGYDIRFVIPGIPKDAVDLDVEGRTLILKTHANQPAADDSRSEASKLDVTDYAASVDLPELADPATLTAALANGILTVKVAKRPETQARRIAIA